jgi:hypothetical protein
VTAGQAAVWNWCFKMTAGPPGFQQHETAPTSDAKTASWNWSFKTTGEPPGFQQYGSAASLEEAQAAVEAQWTRWLAAAGLRDI